jgi:acetyl-CoA carboxylase carboxyl transferase subunit alpha
MSKFSLEFEQPLKELDDRITQAKSLSSNNNVNNEELIRSLESQLLREQNNIYSNLTRWQKVEIARHPLRPHTSDYINNITTEWIEVHGDRKFSDDKAIITGFGMIDNVKYAIIGQEKGRTTKEKLKHNFGMTKPEGYRKALRIMKLAEKFRLPIISFIDTPGAYPGIGAEERGQSQAIADNLFEMSTLDVPIISIVIGEGASGGALAIGLADRIICLEYSWYSVISPEGCASILFGDPSFNKEAAELLKVNSRDLFDMNIADKIINEPLGGAHNDEFMVYNSVKDVISNEYKYLKSLSRTKLVDERIKKYNNIGVFKDE